MASKGNVALVVLIVILAIACIGLLIAYIGAVNVSVRVML